MAEPLETGRSKTPQFDMPSILRDATDFTSAKVAITKAIKELRSQGVTRIGFVSGPVGNTSSFVDDENGTAMQKSMREMKKVTEEMIAEHKFPIFSSTDIFWAKWEELAEGKQINEGTLAGKEKETAMNNFFGGILEESGITDIFMMKGWRKAPGALYEHSIAVKPGSIIHIHDLDLKK